jgi:hypothetical protein
MSGKVIEYSSGGVSFTTLLTLLFIGLKLGHVITWSWLWVLCPLWLGLAFSALCVAGILLFAGTVMFFACLLGKK